ncbi:transglutaminase domain-containing protein [Spirosoma soli]|uniref:Transglutaminase domain-containing protein n=1 Tax=Spirosoma soli TaxID=1770529 RepID=A0ABW5MBK5_9BACT
MNRILCLKQQSSILFVLLLLSSVATVAQNNHIRPNVTLGLITPDGFTSSSTDSTAEAVVLYESGEVSFEVNTDQSWVIFTHHVRTLIRKKSAYHRATVQLTVRRGYGTLHEKMSDLEGYTYNLVNGVLYTDPLDLKNARFTEKAADDYWIEKFTMPNVREGSVIDYKYTVKTPFIVNRTPEPWYFQRDIPVDWSQYQITIPSLYPHKIILNGYHDLDVNEVKPIKISLVAGERKSEAQLCFYAIKHVPAFRKEAYITTEEDYLSRLDIEPPNYKDYRKEQEENFTWEAIDRRLKGNENFGYQLEPKDWLRKLVESRILTESDTLSRIKAACDFVAKTMTWDRKLSIWAGDLKQVLADKKGDSGDINILLIAVLRAMGIRTYPVILSTSTHGRIREELALLRRFNYVVAMVSVNGKPLFLDATDAYLSPGMLPIHCLNGIGRLIDPPHSRFVPLPPTERLIGATISRLTLNEAGELKGTHTQSYGGYGAWLNRRLLNIVGEPKYLETIRENEPDWQIEKASFTGISGTEGTFNIDYALTVLDACTQAGERVYLRPLITEAYTENPFREPKRQNPVHFGVPIDETFTATYTLPSGFLVEQVPKPIAMSMPHNGGRFIYKVSVEDGQIRVDSRVILRKAVYEPSEYGALRELYTQIVAKHTEPIVLKRGTTATR